MVSEKLRMDLSLPSTEINTEECSCLRNCEHFLLVPAGISVFLTQTTWASNGNRGKLQHF